MSAPYLPSRESVLLSVQRALLGEIVPSLCGVACSWTTGVVKLRFLFEGPINPADEERMRAAGAEVAADFARDVAVEEDFVAISSPADLRSHSLEGWAFIRADYSAPTSLQPAPATNLSFAGLALDRPLIMGVVNVTPDSFSDGGDFAEREAAIAQALRLREEGADIIDVGGESTRPGAAPLGLDEEIRRVLPVVAAAAQAGAVVSIDTRHAAVMRAALAAGATIVNDVTALADPSAIDAVRDHGAAAVLMHMQGEPATMQREPHYDDVVEEVATALEARVAACVAGGIARARLAIDPGIGFGKTVAHNLALLAGLPRLVAAGLPVLVGVSRKSFIARLSAGEPPKQRLPGSLAAALWAVQHGAAILRVHDVAATRQALAVWRAIAGAGRAGGS